MPSGIRHDGPCIVDGCTKPHHSRGLCHQHYKRVQRNGQPVNKTLACRFDGHEWEQPGRGRPAMFCPTHRRSGLKGAKQVSAEQAEARERIRTAARETRRNEVVRLYVERQMSLAQISTVLEQPRTTVRNDLKVRQIASRGVGRRKTPVGV